MKFNSAQVNAVLRHVYTALGAGLTVAMVLGLSPEDQAGIMAAVRQIGDGVALIVAGIGALVPIVSALYSAFTASAKSQVKAVDAMPNVAVVPTNPAGQALVDSVRRDPPPS